MFWKKYTWQKAAENEADIKLNRTGIGTIELNGKKICVLKQKNDWYGFAYHCPHAGAAMTESYIDLSGNIVCPLHGYKFSLKNGRSKSPEGFCIKVYPVEQRKDGFYIGFEDKEK